MPSPGFLLSGKKILGALRPPGEIKREYVFLFLLLFYCLAYIYSPYSAAFDRPWVRIGSFTVLFFFGIIWAGFSSSLLRPGFKTGDLRFYSLITILLCAVNYRAMNADIPWRGDEDYHMTRTLGLYHYLSQLFTFKIFLLWLMIAAAIILFLISKKLFSKTRFSWAHKGVFFAVLSSAFFMWTLVFYPQAARSILADVLRYPYVQKWIGLLLVFPDLYGNVARYRLLPFLCVVFIAWVLYETLSRRTGDRTSAFLFSFGAVTTPLIYFYSSLLYLEMPVVLLMTVCLIDLRQVITSKTQELMTRPSWICLLLVSFLKETVFLFPAVILGIRFTYQILSVKGMKTKLNALWRETGIVFLGVAPWAIYIFFRLNFNHERSYACQWHNLARQENYFILFKSFLDQTGFLFLLGASGLALIFKKDRMTGFALLCLASCLAVFFLCEQSKYIGSSRWNLFFVPLILCGALETMASLKKYFRLAAIAMMLIFNFIFLPVHADGVRLPNWGCPGSDNAEYTYPYERAVRWLAGEGDVRHVLILGGYYKYYGFDFYLNKYNFHPAVSVRYFGMTRYDRDTEISKLKDFMESYGQSKQWTTVDTILYHAVNSPALDESVFNGSVFKIVKKVDNSEHCIYILRKADSGKTG